MCTDLELGPRVCSWGRPLGGCAEERAAADTFKAAAARASACAPNRWASDPSRQLKEGPPPLPQGLPLATSYRVLQFSPVARVAICTRDVIVAATYISLNLLKTMHMLIAKQKSICCTVCVERFTCAVTRTRGN